MLPDPALTLTIPSLHDGTTLDCRLYHPASLAAASPRAPPWRRHAAVVAHPYAPMGGCYDDAVVEAVAAQLLRTGYLVGTFNFRGAGHSAGRTSWTAKPERDDYASFVGFMVHYVHRLDPFRRAPGDDDDDEDDDDYGNDDDDDIEHGNEDRPKADADADAQPDRPPVLLMCGYSYGAMVTTQLGPLDSLLEPFTAPAVDSEAAEIRLRAEHLARDQNSILGSVRAEAMAALRRRRQRQRRRQQQQQQQQQQDRYLLVPTSPGVRSGVRIGGDEGGGGGGSSSRNRRKSHEGFRRRSFSLEAEDRLRKGVQDLLAKTRSRHDGGRQLLRRRTVSAHGRPKTAPSASPPPRRTLARAPSTAAEAGHEAVPAVEAEAEAEAEAAAAELPLVADFTVPRPAYLLVSPLQGLVTHLATMSLLPSALVGRARHQHEGHGRAEAGEEAKLVGNPTLAVYGDRDALVPAGKLRAWSGRLEALHGSLFRALEVASAGHFWAEDGVLEEMKQAAGQFAAALAAACPT